MLPLPIVGRRVEGGIIGLCPECLGKNCFASRVSDEERLSPSFYHCYDCRAIFMKDEYRTLRALIVDEEGA